MKCWRCHFLGPRWVTICKAEILHKPMTEDDSNIPNWRPEMPPQAAMKSPFSHSFRSAVQGEWSETTIDIVPSINASHNRSWNHQNRVMTRRPSHQPSHLANHRAASRPVNRHTAFYSKDHRDNDLLHVPVSTVDAAVGRGRQTQ